MKINGKGPHFMIVNTDSSDKKGTHWTVLYVEKDEITYFCSQACFPSKDILSYLKQYTSYYINQRKVQPYSSTICGLYCIAYCILRMKGLCHECAVNSIIKYKNKDNFVIQLCNSYNLMTRCVTSDIKVK